MRTDGLIVIGLTTYDHKLIKLFLDMVYQVNIRPLKTDEIVQLIKFLADCDRYKKGRNILQ